MTSFDTQGTLRRIVSVRRASLICLADAAPGGDLPTEFRIFAAGANDTSKGTFLFDEIGAALTMGAAAKRGLDFMIDLEHQALDPFATDPTARDARGWFQLALRNGELWAVNVTWTEDGATRLRERRQRYISAAFSTDPENRIVEIVNVAMTALPASYQILPLVASARDPRSTMTLSEQIKAALDSLRSGDLEAVGASLESVFASLEKDPPPPPDQVAADAAAAAELRQLTAALAGVAGRSNVEAVKHYAQLSQAQAQSDAVQRRALVIELIKLGAETPATAWSGDKVQDRLANEDLASLSARVKSLGALQKLRATAEAEPPPSGAAAFRLSEIEQRTYDKLPNDEAKAKFKAIREARHYGESQ